MKTKKETTQMSLKRKTIQKLTVPQKLRILGGKKGGGTGDTSGDRCKG